MSYDYGNTEHIVYEAVGKAVGHPVAVYDNPEDLVRDWVEELNAGTHRWFSIMKAPIDIIS